jgi:hypothetical protein
VSRLAAAFGVDLEVARRDVSATLAQWNETLLAEVLVAQEAPEVEGGGGVARMFDYCLEGKRFRVSFDSDDLVAEIVPRLAHLGSSPAPPDFSLSVSTCGNSVRLSQDGEVFGIEETVSGARAILLQEMVRLARGEGEWLALLHAGACSTGSACVVFPAASGCGKSTLAAVLKQSGLSFHADDSVGILRETRAIPPMPFGIAIREGSWAVAGARIPGFDELPVVTRYGQLVRFVEPGSQSGPVPAVALVFPLYDADARTSVRRLSMLDVLIHLKQSGFWVEHTEEGIGAFLKWVEAMPSYRIVYSEVEDAVRFIRGIASAYGCP